MKVIRYLENRGILLKGATQKINSEEGGFFQAINDSWYTPLAKRDLVQLQMQLFQMQLFNKKNNKKKKKIGSQATALIISKGEMEDIM